MTIARWILTMSLLSLSLALTAHAKTSTGQPVKKPIVAKKSAKTPAKKPLAKTAPKKNAKKRQYTTANPGAQWLLTAAQLDRLTDSEKKAYIREVRKIMVDMAERSAFFADSMVRTRNVASVEDEDQNAQDQLKPLEFMLEQVKKWRGEVPKDYKAFQGLDGSRRPVDEVKEKYRTNYEQSLYWLIRARQRFHDLKEAGIESEDLTKMENEIKEHETRFAKQRRLYTQKGAFDESNSLKPAYDAMFAQIDDPSFKFINFPSDSLCVHGYEDVCLNTPEGMEKFVKINQTKIETEKVQKQKFEKHDKKAIEPMAKKRENVKVEIIPEVTTPAGNVDTITEHIEPASATEPIAEATESEEKAEEKVEEAIEEKHTVPDEFRCMYAGFILKKDPCKPVTSLTRDIMDIPTLDHSKLKCESGKLLCNPLLFGVAHRESRDIPGRVFTTTGCELKLRSVENEEPEGYEAQIKSCLLQAKPLCVANRADSNATAICAQASNSEESLESAVLLIKYNPDSWDKYIEEFYELCDETMIASNKFADVRDGKPRPNPESVRDDIRETCKIARTRLTTLRDKYPVDVKIKQPAVKEKAPTDTNGTDGQH